MIPWLHPRTCDSLLFQHPRVHQWRPCQQCSQQVQISLQNLRTDSKACHPFTHNWVILQMFQQRACPCRLENTQTVRFIRHPRILHVDHILLFMPGRTVHTRRAILQRNHLLQARIVAFLLATRSLLTRTLGACLRPQNLGPVSTIQRLMA